MIIVTGGSGFIGQRLVERLRETDETIRVFDIQPYPDRAIETSIGDIRNKEEVKAALQGATTVYHAASYVHIGAGRPQKVYDINVTGTQNIIEACLAHGVNKLIYMSSCDVVLGMGQGSPEIVDESIPYPTEHLSYYGETKALAEQLVLKANGTQNLLTCALRPLAVYGEGDKFQTPAILKMIHSGRITRVGDGTATSMQGYVDNIVHAHILVAQHLAPNSPVCGQAYFVGDECFQNYFDFLDELLAVAKIELPHQTIPAWLAMSIAKISDWLWVTLPNGWMPKPILSQHALVSIVNTFKFSIERAKRDFGYQPIVPRDEAIHRTGLALRKAYAKSKKM